MPDLITNTYMPAKLQETGNNKYISANSLAGSDKIQLSEKNRELFSSFIIKTKDKDQKNDSVPENNYSWTKYKKNLKDKKKIETGLTVAVVTTLILGGVSLILGKQNLINLRTKLSESIEVLQSLKAVKQFTKAEEIKLSVTKFFNNTLGYLFSFDKIKDFSLLKFFESLGTPGKMVVNAGKSSLRITEKTTLPGLYRSFKMSADSLGKSVNKSLNKPEIFSDKEEKELLQKLNDLINGNKGTKSKGLISFADDLINGTEKRIKLLKKTVQEKNIDTYRKKYYPEALNLSEFKRAGKNWKEFLFSSGTKKDVLRENRSETEEILQKNINKTGTNSGTVKDFGEAKKQLEIITNKMEELSSKPACSKEFKNLTNEVKALNQRVNDPTNMLNPLNFEISGDKYAGRVLDILAGGGMSEILIPPVAGGIIVYQNLKDSKPDERKETFIKSGGPALIGGLTGWMITANLLAVSGATGLLAGIVTGTVFNVMSKIYLKHLEKTEVINKKG